MQVFVTGATGFIGRNLVETLLERRWQVSALVRSRARAGALPGEVSVIHGSLSDPHALAAGASGADVVYHLAAATDGGWETHSEATVEGTRRMLRIADEAKVGRFILASSIVVYNKSGLKKDALLDESSPLLAPTPAAGAYARGKLEAEALARAFSQDDDPRMEVVIVRPGLVYGADRLTFHHLGEPVGQMRIGYGPRALRLPLVEVRSCVDALVRLATAPGVSGKTYNIADGHDSTRREYLAALAAATGYRQRVLYLPAAPVAAVAAAIAAARKLRGQAASGVSAAKIRERAVEMRYDTSALQEDTGWRPLRDLEEGMARAGIGTTVRKPPRDVERVGLVGAGTISRLHLAAVRKLPGVRITGVLDLDPAAAESLAREAGVPAYTEPKRFYEAAKPELVHVLTPPHTHTAVALEALRHGAHVLLEKPAATTLDDCDALKDAADSADRTVGVDETVAWDPLIRRARAALVNGVVGQLVDVDIFMSHDLNRGGRLQQIQSAAGSWERHLAGGPLEDILPHPLAVVRALCGNLDLAHAHSTVTGRLPGDFPDELRLALGTGNVTAQVRLSLSARPDDFVMTLRGTRASIRIDLLNMLFDCATPLPGPRAMVRGLCVLRSASRILGQTARNGMSIATRRGLPPASPAHLIRAHYCALARGEPPPAPIEHARADVAIARSVWPMPELAPVADSAERQVAAASVDTSREVKCNLA